MRKWWRILADGLSLSHIFSFSITGKGKTYKKRNIMYAFWRWYMRQVWTHWFEQMKTEKRVESIWLFRFVEDFVPHMRFVFIQTIYYVTVFFSEFWNFLPALLWRINSWYKCLILGKNGCHQKKFQYGTHEFPHRSQKSEVCVPEGGKFERITLTECDDDADPVIRTVTILRDAKCVCKA